MTSRAGAEFQELPATDTVALQQGADIGHLGGMVLVLVQQVVIAAIGIKHGGIALCAASRSHTGSPICCAWLWIADCER